MPELDVSPHDCNQNPILQGALPEINAAIETGTWPAEYFRALLTPVAEWADRHPTGYHHTGYTYPNREAFEAAISGTSEELVANNLHTPTVSHQRRYACRFAADGGPNTFIEYHMVGEEGNGVHGIHFDFITEDAEGMLAFIQAAVENSSVPGTKIVTQPFGGGNAPIGKVELQPLDNPKLSVGVMIRTHWSNPKDW